MSTLASIILYALAVFMGSMVGFGAGKTRGTPTRETEDTLTFGCVALLLFFALAVALQVTS